MMDLTGSQTDSRRQDVHSSAVEVFLRSSYFGVLLVGVEINRLPKKLILSIQPVFFFSSVPI